MNLVTGATGMLGIHVMLELLQRGESVRGLKRKDSDLHHARNIFNFYSPEKNLFEEIQWVEGDVLDIDALLDAMDGCPHVYHCAAIVSYHKLDRAHMYEVNIEGTANVVNCAIEMKVAKLCHVSSIAAMSKTRNGEWISEESEWKDSDLNTHYAITKNLAEMEVWRGIQEGLNAVIVNPGLIIGPGDPARSSTSMFKRIGEGLKYYPPGGTGVIGAGDCARIMVELMKKDIVNERFLLVAENITMKDTFRAIAKSLGKIPAEKLASPGMIEIARLAEFLKEKFTGQKAVITRESARNAGLQFFYKNEKVKAALGRDFESVASAIESTGRFFRNA